MSSATYEIWRVGIALLLAKDLIDMLVEAAVQQASGFLEPTHGLLGQVVASTPALLAIGALGLALLALFVARPGHLRGWGAVLYGLAALGVTGFAFELHVHAAGLYNEDHVYSGAVMAGWCVGAGAGRWLAGAPGGGYDRWAAARYGGVFAVGVLGGIYTCAAISKVAASGLGWVDSERLRAVGVMIESPDAAFLAPFRWALVESPALAWVLAAATLVAEAAGALMWLGGRWQSVVAGSLIALHVGIGLTTGIWFDTAILCLLLVGFDWGRLPRLARRFDPADVHVAPVRSRRVGLAVVFLAALSAGLWSLQLVGARPNNHPRYEEFKLRHQSGKRVDPRVANLALRHLGGLEVGAALPEQFTVATIEVRADRVVVVTLAGPYELMFTVEDGAAAEHGEPPFRLGGRALYYQTTDDVTFERLQPVVAAAVERVAGIPGQDAGAAAKAIQAAIDAHPARRPLPK